jgi:type IV pilus assembly protein PilW
MKHFLPRALPRRQRGVSIVELMIGFAVGLFIMGGAVKLFVDYLSNNRKLLLETRVNQDLRSAADLVVRDLRRAGYWQNASSLIWVPNAANTGGSYTNNPYRTITTGTANGSASITYSYAKDNDDASGSAENGGFRIGTDSSLQMLNGGTWQSVSDPNAVTMTMAIAETLATIELYEGCPCLSKTTCTAASFLSAGANYATRPRAVMSEYTITLTGALPSNPTKVKRTITEIVRVRNDSPTGTCPP